jgi:hypothetical protein
LLLEIKLLPIFEAIRGIDPVMRITIRCTLGKRSQKNLGSFTLQASDIVRDRVAPYVMKKSEMVMVKHNKCEMYKLKK